MTQLLLPIFPDDTVEINNRLCFKKANDQVTYFLSALPIFMHAERDIRSFRMITSQFYVNGLATQAEIIRAFGVSKNSVIRAVKRYKLHGAEGFYKARKTRGAAVLTPPVLEEVQVRLDKDESLESIAQELQLKKNTLEKAVRSGRLHIVKKKESPPKAELITKSQRTEQDSQAVLGMGATHVMERLAASIGALQNVTPKFYPVADVPYGGLLLALPALLSMGLLSKIDEHFVLPPGYYSLESLFLLLAFVTMARIKTLEGLRYTAPGEWGKLLGLDRVPEVRTLRQKVLLLSQADRPAKWGEHLSQEWIKTEASMEGVFYVDGHVRVYHGSQTSLPRHYVTREKLCLRATVDYWVNALEGQPFFFINQPVDHGLIDALKTRIIPRLEEILPKTDETSIPRVHRFTLIFDREGYSPKFMQYCLQKNIACITYRKYVKETWDESEFTVNTIHRVAGNSQSVLLAERGIKLGKKHWVREIRRLNKQGQQTSIISTDFRSNFDKIVAQISDRWTQENFFRYMRQHYNLDGLVDYSLEAIDETIQAVNPDYRRFSSQIAQLTGKHNKRLATFAAMHLDDDIEPDKMEDYEKQKANLLNEIEQLSTEIVDIKARRKEIKRHIAIKELPEEERFERLAMPRKQLIDTIKMIAYRAETAMANILRPHLARPDEARKLLTALYKTEVNLIPDEKNQILTVQVHHMANHASDNAIKILCNELNETEIRFPGTNLKLIYKFGTS